MWRFLLVILFLVSITIVDAKCPIGSVQGPSDSACYSYSADATSWLRAEEQCLKLGGHLASVSDGFVNSFLSSTGCGATSDRYWLGGSLGIKGAQWSWTDGSAFAYTNWAKGQPLTGNDQLCLSLNLQFGTWESEACFGFHPYICRVPSQAEETQCTTRAPTKCRQQVTCPSGWTYFDLTRKCYKLVFNVRYYDALALCESSNGTLASVHSAEENTMLGQFASKHMDITTRTWLGLHAPNGNDSDQWEWTDGTKVDYLNWGAGQGITKTSACVQITNDVSSSGPVVWMDHWYNDPCETVHPAAICQREAFLP